MLCVRKPNLLEKCFVLAIHRFERRIMQAEGYIFRHLLAYQLNHYMQLNVLFVRSNYLKFLISWRYSEFFIMMIHI